MRARIGGQHAVVRRHDPLDDREAQTRAALAGMVGAAVTLGQIMQAIGEKSGPSSFTLSLSSKGGLPGVKISAAD